MESNIARDFLRGTLRDDVAGAVSRNADFRQPDRFFRDSRGFHGTVQLTAFSGDSPETGNIEAVDMRGDRIGQFSGSEPQDGIVVCGNVAENDVGLRIRKPDRLCQRFGILRIIFRHHFPVIGFVAEFPVVDVVLVFLNHLEDFFRRVCELRRNTVFRPFCADRTVCAALFHLPGTIAAADQKRPEAMFADDPEEVACTFALVSRVIADDAHAEFPENVKIRQFVCVGVCPALKMNREPEISIGSVIRHFLPHDGKRDPDRLSFVCRIVREYGKFIIAVFGGGNDEC